ncbi:MAG: ribosome small subunit-dependent GTPase A [Chloroflexi bacterium]|nr:ribosome small subunit-dependent GTPase A [Chloroflexota bacterium]
MHGIVLRVLSDFIDVLTDEGERWQCKLLGRLKRRRRRTTLIVAGDRVRIKPVNAEKREGLIVHIAPRTRALSRRRPGSDFPIEDVILANPDEIMVVFAAARPEPNLHLLDRFLVAAEASEVEHIFIVINKIDLTGEEKARALFGLYEDVGYPVFYTSAVTGAGVDALKRQLRDRITVLAGPSGVGKSSLINRIEPSLNLRVGKVMDIGKGRHTTRRAELHPLSGGGFIADTPGLRELGLWDVRPEELSDYFPEIRRLAPQCRFADCTHVTEPDCAVREAVKKGEIFPQRWESYTMLFYGLDVDDATGLGVE